jgi:excisionase family DNA binding protein
MEISILEAAKTLKIGRSTIYKKIESGELSRSHSGKLDTSELFRVFGSSVKTQKTPTRHPLKTPVDTSQDTTETVRNTPPPPDISAQLAHLQAENAQLKERLTETRERLEEAKDREGWQRGQIERLTDTIKLLEAPKKTITARGWFERLFNRY